MGSVNLESAVKDSKSCERRSRELQDFKKLLESYEPLGEFQPPGNPDEKAATDEATRQYHSMGADLWKIALLVTEHLPEEVRIRELAWMKDRLQTAGMMVRDG